MNTLVRATIEGTKIVEEQFTTPDAEWEPFLFIVRESGVGTVIPIEAETAEEAHRQMYTACKVLEAKEAAVVMGAWTLVTTPEEEATRTHELAEDPARQEALLVTYVTADGEAELWMAPVWRNPDKPALGMWAMRASGDAVMGPVAAALRDGME